MTVHVLEAFCPRLVGLQASEDTVTGGTRVIVALADVLLYVAVTVAVWPLLIVVVVALNVAVVAPAGTVTDVGVVSAALLFETVTVAPPAGAD